MAYEIGLATPDVPNRGFPLWIVSVVMVIVAGIFVLTRVGIRYYQRRLGWDDWTILASLICSILLSITECSAVHNGYGKHYTDLTPHERIVARKWFFGAQVMYKIVIGVNKASFLCLYLRIFIQPAYRWACYGGIGVVTSWTLAYLLTTIFQCKPIAAFWDSSIKNPSCLDNEPLWMSYSIINLILDLAVLIMPIYPLSQLRLQRAKKIGVFLVFAMGAFVCVTTILRTTTLAQSAGDKDPTSGPIPATIWSVVEANTGIICACLPVLKHPVQFLFPKIFDTQPSTDVYSLRKARHTPHASSSQHNLKDANDDLWRDDNAVEMGPGGTLQGGSSGGITKITDIKVSYQEDGKSDASSPITHSREF